MRANYRGRILCKCQLHHLTRIDAGAIDSTAEQLDEFNQLMTGVQKHHTEGLMLEHAKLDTQKVPYYLR